MTDITRYKSVALSHESSTKLDDVRKVIATHTIVSRAQCLNILINKEHKKLNGKIKKEDGTTTKTNKRPRR